jgi:hypothetical protein
MSWAMLRYTWPVDNAIGLAYAGRFVIDVRERIDTSLMQLGEPCSLSCLTLSLEIVGILQPPAYFLLVPRIMAQECLQLSWRFMSRLSATHFGHRLKELTRLFGTSSANIRCQYS